MATLASLVVSLEANIARFESDLTKAEQVTRRAMDTIANVSETAMKAVKGALAGMVAAYTFDAFADGIKGAIESAAELDRIAAALETLPPNLKGIVVLKDVYGLSHEAIAAELGISVANAKVRLHRARRKLQERLDGAGDGRFRRAV
mgnify:CR=1 FL=1